MKKWFKECPFCANEIKEKAVKCQYCWEFLPKEEKKEELKKKVKKETKECPFCMNKIDVDATVCPLCDEELDQWSELKETNNFKIDKKPSKSLKSAIIAWKFLKRWCIICLTLLWIAYLWWITDMDFVDSEGFAFLDLLMWICFIVLLMIWGNKAYAHLLNSKIKKLRFDSTWWPTWWWICPVACLFIPYQVVRDIYKTVNNKTWIVWWWWTCMIISSILLRTMEMWDDYVVILLACWFVIARYVLTLIIINKVNEERCK